MDATGRPAPIMNADALSLARLRYARHSPMSGVE